MHKAQYKSTLMSYSTKKFQNEGGSEALASLSTHMYNAYSNLHSWGNESLVMIILLRDLCESHSISCSWYNPLG